MTATDKLPPEELPLRDIKVVELVHTVMGPSCGVVLADLGADVIKIEPLGGDVTRRLAGSGAGYWAMFNRNKRSIALDLKSEEGRAVALDLIRDADVMTENYGPGTIERLGLGWADVQKVNPKLVFCSLKGFLGGPYENRMALDEVCQIMGGLAYMTGLPGRPLRAGASVIDVMGGMFGVVGILSALHEREKTGLGKHVKSALFESTLFLVGQHMAFKSVTGKAMPPMSVRLSAWCVYDIFETRDGEQCFLGLVTDNNWKRFCAEFGYDDWLADPGLKTNAERVHARDRNIPRVTAMMKEHSLDEIVARFARASLPFAPIGRPEDMFDDPHLNEGGGLLDLDLETGVEKSTRLPVLPLEFAGQKLGLRRGLPGTSEHARAVLQEAGYDDARIDALFAGGAVQPPG
jgi:crotonobetainyl-CoA:carnitine CoA-transferase CaiB-like acyl-CoA transferase